MKTVMKPGKDNLLMSALLLSGAIMVALGPLTNDGSARATLHSVADSVSAPVPAAMTPIPYRDAAIIVTAPRIRSAA